MHCFPVSFWRAAIINIFLEYYKSTILLSHTLVMLAKRIFNSKGHEMNVDNSSANQKKSAASTHRNYCKPMLYLSWNIFAIFLKTCTCNYCCNYCCENRNLTLRVELQRKPYTLLKSRHKPLYNFRLIFVH